MVGFYSGFEKNVFRVTKKNMCLQLLEAQLTEDALVFPWENSGWSVRLPFFKAGSRIVIQRFSRFKLRSLD